MDALSEKLLNDYQRNFPLKSMPFTHIAQMLNTSTETVLRRLKELQARGAVSRVGPVFRPNTVGASTLAAMAVAPEKLDSTAAIVSGFAQVNHNYEREHRYNLWFVVTEETRESLAHTLQRIEQAAGYPVLSLPLVRDYHIDLGFRMQLGQDSDVEAVAGEQCDDALADDAEARLGSAEDLIEVIQGGLPLVARPYHEIGCRLGWSEQSVIRKLGHMLDSGVIKRLGVVVRHHELGYRANAMVVWDVTDERVDRLGEQLGRQDCVTLCYQRPRHMPDWPYNLFCMVHGKDRDDVRACIERMVEGLGLESIRYSVLFSGRRYKQRGARYRLKH